MGSGIWRSGVKLRVGRLMVISCLSAALWEAIVCLVSTSGYKGGGERSRYQGQVEPGCGESLFYVCGLFSGEGLVGLYKEANKMNAFEIRPGLAGKKREFMGLAGFR
ncbi:hypothetical protein DSLASN_02160 [Desulfoluna limicola]|uniref:Uncharacterized protein n=1 Tax=Desulfoluna limicola TaxID=2810562 RepID=A0ABM7PBL4_9BACT|nr:hypothetical protein DSLASN_02160 [Desulfoluna limicola]